MKAKFLFVFMAILLPLMTSAQVKIGDIYYDLNHESKTALVTGEFMDDPGGDYSGDIVIPESVEYGGNTYSVTSIGYRAFFGCRGLTSVTIPNSVKYIVEEAFCGCRGLTSVTIPNSVKYIGEDAFQGCSLTSVTIPNSVTSIKQGAFADCPLNSIIIDSGNQYYDSRDQCNAIINSATNELIFGCKNTVIPNSVTSIGSGAFDYCTGLTSVTIPNSVTSIGSDAFYGCSGLTSVTIPNSVTSIGYQAFAYCTSLTSVSIYNSVMGYLTFEGCSGLTDMLCYTDIVPKGFIVPKGYDSWFDKTDISSITLHVYDYTIESFKALNMGFKDIVVFEKTTDFNLTYLVDGEEYKKEQHKYEDEIIPEAEPTKKGMTFSGWSEIPEKMPGKDVNVTGTFTWSKDKISGIIYQVTDTINNNAAVIDTDNVSGEVKIVSSVDFDYTYSVTDIIDNVFKNNTNITSVVIPESVRKIGDEAFYGCKNLAKIELGKSVNQIEARAFAGIDKLTDLSIYAEDVPSTDRTAFENSYIEDYVTLHVPAGSLEKYKAAAPWKNFNEIKAIDGTDEGQGEDPSKDEENEVVTIKESGKTTFCSEYDLDFTNVEGVKAYTATGYDDMDKIVWLTRVMKVPAGTGIMIKGTPGEYKIPHATVRATYANYLKGNLGESIRIEETDGDYTNYYLSGGTFKSVNGYANIGKGKAYLQLPTSVFAGTRSIEVNYSDEEGTTGMNSTKQIKGEKAVYYNLQGQRVDKPRKGLYVLNGKKVVIK